MIAYLDIFCCKDIDHENIFKTSYISNISSLDILPYITVSHIYLRHLLTLLNNVTKHSYNRLHMSEKLPSAVCDLNLPAKIIILAKISFPAETYLIF